MRILTIIFIFLAFTINAFSKTVSVNDARLFAIEFIQNRPEQGFTIKSVDEIKHGGQTTSYLFSLQPIGFIIISGDDTVEPLLGYSFDSEPAKQSEWPEHLSFWMDNTNQKILHRANDISAQRNKAWDKEAFSTLKSAQQITVSPILNVRWDQGRNWNMFCPEDEKGPGGRTWVGCVAVSMAQAMSVYGYPEKGKGKASYIHSTYGTQTVDFEKQEPYSWDSMPSASANEHNARLLYHAAVTVNMDFGPDGSGAYSRTAASALKAYFNYSKTTDYQSRVDNDDEWKKMLNENLEKGYPLIYHGDGDNGQSGHAWNIDGVDIQGMYHVNWGWSGSMNGYFNINNLAPGSNDFTKNQGAIFGIKPKVPGPIDIVLSNTTVREKLPAGSFVGKVTVDDEFPDNKYTYHLKGNPIIIGDGYAAAKFYVENDTLKTLEEFDFEKRTSYVLYIEVVDTIGNSLEKKFDISIEKAVSAQQVESNDDVKVYPNPFSEFVTIDSKQKGQINIYNLQGQKVYFSSNNEYRHYLDLSTLRKGSYIVQLKGNTGTFYQKITKQ